MTDKAAHIAMGVAPQEPGQSPMAGRTLILGGSFNPVHIGHLICARHAAEVCGFSKVRLVPTAANPHKQSLTGSADLAGPQDRLLMCQLAVAGDSMFEVDPIEIERPGNSYTFDTASAFIARGEPAPIAWLIGTDILARLHTWHRFDELLGMVEFVVMSRAGQPLVVETLDARVQKLVLRLIEVPQVQASSTAIRMRVRGGQSIAHWVPPAVARHIANRHLYTGSPTKL